jgi:hypothetical protein
MSSTSVWVVDEATATDRHSFGVQGTTCGKMRSWSQHRFATAAYKGWTRNRKILTGVGMR